MKCTHPILLRSEKTNMLQSVPCGRCMACRMTRVTYWKIRLQHEQLLWDTSVFLTLTYNDEHLPKNNSLQHNDIKLFFKRLRKKTGKKIRYFCAGEYGAKDNRPHYHLIIFGMSRKDKILFDMCWREPNKPELDTLRQEYLEDGTIIKWDGYEDPYSLGFSYVGDVNSKTIRYTCGYIVDKLVGKAAQAYEEMGVKPPYCAVSSRPGIGRAYAEKYFNNWCDIAATMPRYYKKLLDVNQKLNYTISNIQKHPEKGKIPLKEVDAFLKQSNLELEKKVSLRKKKL